jgi:hypothetical protein
MPQRFITKAKVKNCESAMKTFISLFIIIIVLAGLNIQAGDSPTTPNPPLLSKPTWNGDDHDQPVYTSPTNVPTATNLPAAKLPPLPPMTNLPTTNLPAMTNPPALQPPSGLHGA